MSITKRRVLSREFKLSALKRYVAGESATAICHELQIRRSDLSKWGARFGREGPEGLRTAGRPRKPQQADVLNAVAKALRDKLGALEWISATPNKRAAVIEKAGLASVGDEPDLAIVLEYLLSNRALKRRRALVILASRRGISPMVICKLLRLSYSTYRRCIRVFADGGATALFSSRRNLSRKSDDEAIRSTLFDTLHQPPSNYRINRTTWKMADLGRIMKERGHPVGQNLIRKIIRTAGYRWRKARIVRTSNDPTFSEKLSRIQSILAAKAA
jgi:transposase/transposase-like protein